MVGKWVFFWDSLFSGSMLNFQGVFWWPVKDGFWLTLFPWTYTDPLDLINQDSNMFLINQELIFDTPRKTNMSPKSDHFSREYIFQPSIFRGHVSFQGSMMSLVGLLFLPPLLSRIYGHTITPLELPSETHSAPARGCSRNPPIFHSLKWSKDSDYFFQCHNWPYPLETITLGRL